jgi:hypothetical protein
LKPDSVLFTERGDLNALDERGKGRNFSLFTLAIQCYKFIMHYAERQAKVDNPDVNYETYFRVNNEEESKRRELEAIHQLSQKSIIVLGMHIALSPIRSNWRCYLGICDRVERISTLQIN